MRSNHLPGSFSPPCLFQPSKNSTKSRACKMKSGCSNIRGQRRPNLQPSVYASLGCSHSIRLCWCHRIHFHQSFLLYCCHPTHRASDCGISALRVDVDFQRSAELLPVPLSEPRERPRSGPLGFASSPQDEILISF